MERLFLFVIGVMQLAAVLVSGIIGLIITFMFFEFVYALVGMILYYVLVQGWFVTLPLGVLAFFYFCKPKTQPAIVDVTPIRVKQIDA